MRGRRLSALLPGALAAAFLLTVPGLAGAQTGDVKRGQELYTAQKCSICHKIGATGGKLGPELTDVGSKRDAAWLEKYLVNPKSLDPKNTMPAVKVPPADLKALIAYLLTLKAK